MIDRFSKLQFENALPKGFLSHGMVKGEQEYEIAIDKKNKVSLVIRSSIDFAGYAANSGEDSIRMWLINTVTTYPLAVKVNTYTQRTPGWQERMKANLVTLAVWYLRSGLCENCNKPMNILRSTSAKNPGRLYSKCFSCQKWGKFVDGDATEGEKNAALVLLGYESPLPVVVEKPVKMEENPLDFLGVKPVAAVPVAATSINLNNLSPYQRAVVENLGKGAVVVEAVPGSGKTFTLENLIAAMLVSGVDPSRIGAFTFSKKGASEMRRRVARAIFPDATADDLAFFENPYGEDELSPIKRQEWVDADPRRRMIVEWICTIHALSLRLLKRAGVKINVLSGEKEREAKNLIVDTIKELDWEESPKAVREWISKAVLNMVNVANAESFYAQALTSLGYSGLVHLAGKLAEVYKRYRNFLTVNKVVDFDLMQANCLWKIRNDPSFRQTVSGMFDYILVDESQDTSDQQAEILFALAEKTGNIMMCGDVDQSMYGFRGARPEVMRGIFEQKWGKVQRLPLPVNFRSTRSIVNTAAKLIANNYDADSPYLKDFQARPNAQDGKAVETVILPEFENLIDEVVSAVQGNDPGSFFVLSRTRAECAAIHLGLIAANIPAVNAVGGNLFGTSHIRKVIAYAQVAVNYNNARSNIDTLSEIANVATSSFVAPMTRRRHVDGCTNTKGWVNCGCPIVVEEGIDYSPARFYGRRSVEAARNYDGIISQTYQTTQAGYQTVTAKGASDFVNFVSRIEKQAESASFALGTIINDCVLPWLKAEEGDVGDLAENGKAEDFGVLLEMVKNGESLVDFLTRVDELMDASNAVRSDVAAVIVGTFHWSKGAERPNVIVNITRCPIVPPKTEPGRLPTGTPPSIEEERRLLYVGITRAKDNALVLQSNEFNGMKLPDSQFLAEIA